LVDASKDETVDVLDALDVGAAAELKLGDPERRPCVEPFERHLGERVVSGRVLYSAAWLGDRPAAPQRPAPRSQR
jgi:hypothetical protein